MIEQYKLMQGVDLPITPEITLIHPKLVNIFETGEEQYFGQIGSFVATPTDLKVELDDIGVNFEEMTDFQLFCIRTESFKNSIINQLLKGMDFSRAFPIINHDGEMLVYDPDTKAVLDDVHYRMLCEYIRAIHGMSKNVEEYGNELTRQMVIAIERETRQHKAYKEFEPFLMNQVSGLINCSESKYDYHTIWDLPYYVFVDAVRRVQKVMEFKGLMIGAWSGMLDTSKINVEKVSWIGKLS